MKKILVLSLFLLIHCKNNDHLTIVDEKIREPSDPCLRNTLTCSDTATTGDYIISFSTGNIRTYSMTSSRSVDPGSEQNFPRSFFNSPSIIPTLFFGLAYHDGFLYIAGNNNQLFRVSVTFGGGSIQLSNSWTTVTNSGLGVGGNIYYLNNNVFNGSLYSGQISEGVFSLDLSNWSPTGFNSYDLFSSDGFGAKSATIIDSKIYVASDDGDGICRMDDISGTNKTNFLLMNDPSPESIVTDGYYLFGNDDIARGFIHKWLPSGYGNVLALENQNGICGWVSPDLGGRIRGFSYNNGCIYASPGASGTNRNIYAIDANTGSVYDLGVEASSSGSVYGVIVIRP